MTPISNFTGVLDTKDPLEDVYGHIKIDTQNIQEIRNAKKKRGTESIMSYDI